MTLEELKEKRLNRKGGMTRTEDNAWYLLMGILIGMEIAFWFWPDVDFYRTVWPALAGAIIGWYIIRRGGKNAR